MFMLKIINKIYSTGYKNTKKTWDGILDTQVLSSDGHFAQSFGNLFTIITTYDK